MFREMNLAVALLAMLLVKATSASHAVATRRRLPICPIVLFLLVSILLLISGTPRGTASSAAAARGQNAALQKTDNQPVLQTGLWTQVGDAVSGPSGRRDHAIAYDSLRGRVVLFGGRSTIGMLGDTWEWDGTDWTQMATESRPTNLIATLAANRYLDVAIQDDTTVDYIKLSTGLVRRDPT